MSMLLALLTGVVISVMVSINGSLSGCVGVYLSAVVIHIVGTVFAFVLCLWRHESIFRKYNVPAWAYLGGVIGVLTTVFNNFAFSRISMTSIVALSLLGQNIASSLIDSFGLLGMKKHKIKKSAWIGMVISFAGVAFMLDTSVMEGILDVLVSLGAGGSIVLSRSINARLSDKAGALAGSFYNHLMGLPCCIVLWLVLADASNTLISVPAPWMLCGGMLGVLVVFLFNITVSRIPALQVTLLSFLGQTFSGILLDFLNQRNASGRLFWGAAVCLLGFLVSLLMEICTTGKQKKEKLCFKKIEKVE